jgi:hypothetical protein
VILLPMNHRLPGPIAQQPVVIVYPDNAVQIHHPAPGQR